MLWRREIIYLYIVYIWIPGIHWNSPGYFRFLFSQEECDERSWSCPNWWVGKLSGFAASHAWPHISPAVLASIEHDRLWVTLPETNSLPLKIGRDPNRKVVFQPSIFRGYVSFRESNWCFQRFNRAYIWAYCLLPQDLFDGNWSARTILDNPHGSFGTSSLKPPGGWASFPHGKAHRVVNRWGFANLSSWFCWIHLQIRFIHVHTGCFPMKIPSQPKDESPPPPNNDSISCVLLLMEDLAKQLIWRISPLCTGFFKVLCIPGGCLGFLPSTVFPGDVTPWTFAMLRDLGAAKCFRSWGRPANRWPFRRFPVTTRMTYGWRSAFFEGKPGDYPSLTWSPKRWLEKYIYFIDQYWKDIFCKLVIVK